MSEQLLMCTPEGFAVNYEINPWMKNQVGKVSPALAAAQWQGLFDRLSPVADISLMPGNPAWPDLVFTANAGLPLPSGKRIILANFKHPQRQGEKALNRAWFAAAGWSCIELPDEVSFEGAGDALFDSLGRLWLGIGPRTDAAAAKHLARHVAVSIRSIELVEPAFYHLDTCFCPLPDGAALYVPEAFDAAGRKRLSDGFGDRLIALTEEEGRLFCTNAICIGGVIYMHRTTRHLSSILNERGFSVIETPLSEFMKSGGSARCLVLSLAGEMRTPG